MLLEGQPVYSYAKWKILKEPMLKWLRQVKHRMARGEADIDCLKDDMPELPLDDEREELWWSEEELLDAGKSREL